MQDYYGDARADQCLCFLNSLANWITIFVDDTVIICCLSKMLTVNVIFLSVCLCVYIYLFNTFYLHIACLYLLKNNISLNKVFE